QRGELGVHARRVRRRIHGDAAPQASLAMSLPLADAPWPGDTGSLAIAVLIGTGFGWMLERAGLGTAPKLAGQFTLTDLTVFKVMFSAVITAMLGAYWLAWIGLLDLARVDVPE